jgi:hypothetical protein
MERVVVPTISYAARAFVSIHSKIKMRTALRPAATATTTTRASASRLKGLVPALALRATSNA